MIFDYLVGMKNKKLLLFLVFGILGFLFVSCKKDTKGSGGGTNSGTSALVDTVLQNVSYGIHAKQIMDIHLPAKRDKNTRLVLMIHGGAWSAGDKNDFTSYIKLIKKEWPGAAIANMNYRLASTKDSIHHPQMMDDIKNAIAAT